MNRIIRIITICILTILMTFFTSCKEEIINEISNEEEIEETNQEVIVEKEVFTFTLQEIKPIEENPFILPIEISPQSGLHKLSVERPQMENITNSDDILDDILDSANEVIKLQNEELQNCIYVETGNQQVNQTVSVNDEYLTVNLEQDEGSWNSIDFVQLSHYAFEVGGLKDSSNSAILLKYRFTGVADGFCLMFSNGRVVSEMFVSFNGDMNLWTHNKHYDNGIETFSQEYRVETINNEYFNSLYSIDDEWYYLLIAIDEKLGYRFITWQETNPLNNAFYACDLSEIYTATGPVLEQYIWAGIGFGTEAKEARIDIESLTVYEFENFNDVDIEDEIGIISYDYTDDYEKYQLAVQFFNNEDYYNAYILLKELNGYDTSGTYLTECERLLQSVEINNPIVGGLIKIALKKQGIDINNYLYVYQAEILESLDLSNYQIEDLSFLENFPNIKELNLNNTAISDLTGLENLYALERLSLAENHITDILPLYNLTNLDYLDLSNNLIYQVENLGRLNSLKELNLSFNNLYSISGLYGLESLESVDLSNNFICSVNALNSSPIKDLNIYNTGIYNLGAVANLSELEVLKAGFKYQFNGSAFDVNATASKYWPRAYYWEGLKGLEYLSGHQNLKSLNLARYGASFGENARRSGPSFEDDALEPLATMPNLESLNFYAYNGTNGVQTLAKLTNLKELTLSTWGNGFDDITFLSNLTNLEKLSILNSDKFNDVSIISNLTNLKELRMYQHGKDLSFLSQLTNLRLLALTRWNGVDDYSPLTNLDKLEHLELEWMDFNDISLISQINSLDYLSIVNGEKPVDNIDLLSNLKNLKCLQLFVNSTPDTQIANDASYFNQFENLEFLNVEIMQVQDNYIWYTVGDKEIENTLREPSFEYVESLIIDSYGIWDKDSLHNLINYNGGQNLEIIIFDYPYENDEPIRLTIPKHIRNLYINGENSEKKIELDCTGCTGLERIIIGQVDKKGTPYEWGRGQFIVDNLDGLADCINLRELYINDANISDISGIADCKNLRKLQLRNNNITNISALENMIYLREVDLSGNNINNMEVLDSCIRTILPPIEFIND